MGLQTLSYITLGCPSGVVTDWATPKIALSARPSVGGPGVMGTSNASCPEDTWGIGWLQGWCGQLARPYWRDWSIQAGDPGPRWIHPDEKLSVSNPTYWNPNLCKSYLLSLPRIFWFHFYFLKLFSVFFLHCSLLWAACFPDNYCFVGPLKFGSSGFPEATVSHGVSVPLPLAFLVINRFSPTPRMAQRGTLMPCSLWHWPSFPNAWGQAWIWPSGYRDHQCAA